MSLNIYGWQTMPAHSAEYAALVNQNKVDILLIQEGVDDWQLQSVMPTDYSRAESLRRDLGTCWQRQWQILINTCSPISFVRAERFDLADGPNVTRTGEFAQLMTNIGEIVVVNVHLDHESEIAREISIQQIITTMRQFPSVAIFLTGDFNTPCRRIEPQLSEKSSLQLTLDAGIDCIFTNNFNVFHLGVDTYMVDASPSDHPGLIATIFR